MSLLTAHAMIAAGGAMAERMIIYTGQNLDWIEVNGMPRFVDDGVVTFTTAPSAKRVPSKSNVLVWSQRNNSRFVFIGELRDAHLDPEDGRLLRFTEFQRLARPVVIYDDGVHELIDRTELLNDGKGFCNDFSYIADETYARVLAEASRPPPP